MMKVPRFKDPEVTRFLTEYLREVDRTSKDVLYSNKANKSLLLSDYSGKNVYEITMKNLSGGEGELVITKLHGDEIPPP